MSARATGATAAGATAVDLHSWPVAKIAAALRNGSLSARAALEHWQDRITRLNPRFNAFIALDPAAGAAADESDRRFRAGRARGPLEGIPVAIKDNLLAAGMPATWGSRLYADHVPAHDELPVARLRAAGAILIGKTNVPEFTLHGHTDNPLFGITRNPWNPALTPGGSSGGSVAAVAAGLVPLALCTDGGGSIRRPAAYTGLVGLKPSIGRLPRHGGFAPLLADCEVVGPVARTVADARLVYDVLAGPHPLDPSSARLPASRPAARPLRILVVAALPPHPVDPGIAACCAAAVRKLTDLGHRVEDGLLPFDIEAVNTAWSRLGSIGLAALARGEARFDQLASPDFVAMARAGAALTAQDRQAIDERIRQFRRTVREAFQSIDLIVMPSTAAPPWPVEEAYPRTIAGQAVGPRGHAVFTGWVNACGHPAINLPAGRLANGLPVGLQLIGDFGQDEALLDVAAEYEKRLGAIGADDYPVR